MQNINNQDVNTVPLAVDLDGTLIKTDSLVESLLVLVKRNPLYVFSLLFWVVRGKAYFKRQISRRVVLDISSLPYRLELLLLLRDYHEKGRRLILATAANEGIAQQVASYLHIFDMVVASNETINLTGVKKRERLIEEFGEKGFDYAGNGYEDLEVWTAARSAIIVSSNHKLREAASRLTTVEMYIDHRKVDSGLYLKPLRLLQWSKNTLVFIPLIAGHQIPGPKLLAQACLAFLAFGLCASSVYVLNDLLDLSEDRRHPRKRYRSFASGEIPLYIGFLLAPILLGLSILLGVMLPITFLRILALYYGLTLIYSFYFKQIMMLDVIVLAGLFTVRMMAGSAAVDIWPSHWLLAFSMFLFVSLALVKRYAELVIVRKEHGENARARGYMVHDRELLAAMGSASGFISVLVLVLYINSGVVQQFYSHHRLIWLACPLLFFWISHIWLTAHRGAMIDDPLVFALRDRQSWIVFFLLAVIMTIAS